MTVIAQPGGAIGAGNDMTERAWNLASDQEADHRIANSLAMLASMARLHAKRIAQESRAMSGDQVALLLRELSTQIEGIGLLHRLLARRAGGSKLDLGNYLQQLCEALQSGFSFAGRLSCARPPGIAQLVSAEQVRAIAMIICELVTNAFKYAHPTGIPGRIDISYRRAADCLIVDVIDDGVGLPEGFDPTTDGGVGFNLLRRMTGALNGTLTFDAPGIGLQARLSVTLDPAIV